MVREPIALPITEESQVGEARRLAITLASEWGFNQTDCGKIAIVVTEATKNLLKHAQNGELLLQLLTTAEGTCIEIIALDTAPGIQNLSQCLQDGFSTIGTPGNGLGAIQRQSDVFDIYSLPQVGTVLMSRLWADRQETALPFEIGAINLPKIRGDISGDAWAVEQHRDRTLVLVADGLGSGVLAAEASREAVRIFQTYINAHPQALLEKIHTGLRKTRGAVAAIAEILPDERLLRYAGIGNIAGAILTSGTSRSMVSYNGTLGLTLHKVAEFSYPWSENAILVMHSDGLSTHWTIDRYPGLTNRHPALIAAVLYRDFRRAASPDDIAVLVLKRREEMP